MKAMLIVKSILLCSLIALVSSKSVRPLVFRSNITGQKAGNITETPILKREETIDPDTVQVVQDLKDSAEDTSAVVAVENNLNEISDEKPNDVKPLDEKPVVDTNQNQIVSEVLTNDVKPENENDPNPINRYCSCTNAQCKCCRDFSIPLIPVRGPGCATVRYLDNDKLSVSIKYGDFVLASRQIDSRRTTPICVPLPGGYNRFCGRVYGISRENDNFKACLGLELRADDEVEASLRVSCFEFGPRGLATVEADPLPPLESEDGDDDDDDDLFGGLGDDADDDDDDSDDDDDEPATGGAGGLVADVLEGVGVGGGDDDDFGIFRGASDFFGSIFGDYDDDKKKPSNGITVNTGDQNVDAKNKKVEISSSEEKDDDEEDEKDDSSGGIMDAVEAVIEELGGVDDSEIKKETNKHTKEKKEISEEENSKETEENDDYEDENDQYIDDASDYNEVSHDELTADDKTTKLKKNRRDDDYDDSSENLGFWGRFLKFLN